jgi:drug/metabolite transporter (DMT)-like permease
MTLPRSLVPLLGPLCVLAFCVINAVKAVFEGALVQHISPEFLALNYFLLAQLVYLMSHSDKRRLVASVRRNLSDVIAFNLTTALSWLAVLYALATFEPVVVNSIITGLVPSLTIVLGGWLRPGTRPLQLEVLAALGMLATMGYLVVISFRGSSAVGQLSTAEWTFGIFSCGVTAAAVAGNTHYTKRLSEAGMTVREMMACRFVLLIIASAVILTLRHSATAYTPSLVLVYLVLAVFGVLFALHVLQIGITHTEPITVSLLFGTNLTLTFLSQYFDPRLHQSAETLYGVLALTAFVVLGPWARYRLERRRITGSDAEPDGRTNQHNHVNETRGT